MSIPMPPCPNPGTCTYWVVATEVRQATDGFGNYCMTGDHGFNPGCANIGFNELLKYCDGYNSDPNASIGCFDYYSNIMQIFPNGVSPDTLSVDSLINMFALGMHGGFLSYLFPLAMMCAVLIVVNMFSHAISKS